MCGEGVRGSVRWARGRGLVEGDAEVLGTHWCEGVEIEAKLRTSMKRNKFLI